MLNKLHTDTLKVLRVVKSVNEHGRTIQNWTTIYEGIKCRLSQSKLNPTQEGPVNHSISRYKVFVGTDHDIRQNDRLIVIKGGISYEFKASKPIKYTDFIPHQEIPVEEIEKNET